jgi:energy-coupling factor transporter ATP-binding protein EcfA2
MANAIEDLSKLSFDKKEWITDLKNKVCQNGKLEPEDIQIAFDKLLSETELEDVEILSSATTNSVVEKTILSIYDNLNIGGLYDNKKIDFSPLFTLIYGKNGSGKSTYYKALKDAFHSNQNIKGNIYNGNSAESKAKFDFTKKSEHLKFQKKGTNINSGDIETVNWIAGTQHNSRIKFCDGEILKSSLSKKEAGWSVDRYKLGYFDILRDGVTQVETKTNSEIEILSNLFQQDRITILNGLTSLQPSSVYQYLNTNQNNSDLIVGKLKELINLELQENHEDIKADLQRKSTTSVTDYTTKIDLLKSKIITLTNIISFCENKKKLLGQIDGIKEKISRLKTLKSSLDFSKYAQYQLVFNPNTKSEKFIELIKKVAETALSFNYVDYPNDIDKCFYCNQTLPEDNLKFIQEIHSIVGNEVNTEIESLTRQIESFKTEIEQLNFEYFEYNYESVGDLYSLSTKLLITINEGHNSVLNKLVITNLKNELDGFNITSDFNNEIEITDLLSLIATSEKNNLNSELSTNQKDLELIEETKSKSLIELNKLMDLEFCFHQKELLKKTLEKLKMIIEYRAHSSLFTNYKTKISREKGKVEERLIQTDYLQTFDHNLQFFELSKHDKINRTFSNPGGKSMIDVSIKSGGESFSINSILSEGEAKIFSLCDWLTELKYDNSNILVFDDPITSLDHNNIEKVVEKIAGLTKDYQVIVFTHNYEFYHRLLQHTLGGGIFYNAKCQLCSEETEINHCKGYESSTNTIHECSSYYKISRIIDPGHIENHVDFFAHNWETRIEIIRKNLKLGNISEADKNLRTTINYFFEKVVLNDIKRVVYKNNDLITEWRKFKDIEDSDYDTLMEVHNKMSGEATIHEPSPEVKTPMEIKDYIIQFNKVIKAINNIRSIDNPSPPKAIVEIDLS